MKVKAVSPGGSEKEYTFEAFAPRGGWADCRAPGGAGVFGFSLRHGNIEAKRGEHPKWRLCAEDLEKLRAMAREAKVKFSIETPRATKKLRPKAPQTQPNQRQTELFR